MAATKTSAAESRRKVREICALLPEATARERQHIKFEVRGKTFAYFLEDHHGDARIAINVKAAPGQQPALIAAYPERFFMPAYLGPKGWLGLYIDRGKVDWAEVESLLTDSYRMVAPKRLAALVA
jgi:phosphoribosylglycinamide formyltransferase-1